MLSKTIVKKKLEKLGDLYNRVKSRLPADFSFEYTNGFGELDIGHTSDLVDHLSDIPESIRFICNEKAIAWINYYNSAYDELKKYEK